MSISDAVATQDFGDYSRRNRRQIVAVVAYFGDYSRQCGRGLSGTHLSVSVFLDPELITYRYSSCSHSGCFCWGDAVQKNLRLRRFKSDRVIAEMFFK